MRPGADPATTYCVLVGVSAGQRLHLIEDIPDLEKAQGHSVCGRWGRIVRIDLSDDPRQLCSMCAWKS